MISWVDDLIDFGPKEEVLQNQEEFKKHFDVDNIGWMDEHVGCKVHINRNQASMKITQLVLIQSFKDEFDLPTKTYHTPAEPGQVLQYLEESDVLGPNE